MASARKRGKTWMGLYRDADGRQRSAGSHPTEKAAMKAARLAKARVMPGKPEVVYRNTVRGKATVASYAYEWLALHALSALMRGTCTSRYSGSHIIPALGGRVLADVTAADIRGYFRSPGDRRHVPQALGSKIKTVLSAMFQAAAEDRLCPRSTPCVA